MVECVENRCPESASDGKNILLGDTLVVVVHGITRIFSKNILDCREGVLCEGIVTSSGKENTKKRMLKKMSNRKTTMSHARRENVRRVLWKEIITSIRKKRV